MMNQNLLYRIGLTLVKGIGNIIAKQVIESLGEAEALFKEKSANLELIPGISRNVIAEIRNPSVLKRAEKEVLFIENNKITPLFFKDKDYPQQLEDCIDSPVMLYHKGNANLNADKIISIVGTRHATKYGKDVIAQLIKEFAVHFPDMLIVSGLAYGIDIEAHKVALQRGLPTVGVLAHGLDHIYPSEHRQIALEMLANGGLLTDFMSETNPDRQNFVKRNRIVAGISYCTIVIESAEKGGALITSNIASSYNRDVFAVPGKISDNYSKGCNNLIRDNKAALIESAADIIHAMCWGNNTVKKQQQAVQKQIFQELSPIEVNVVDTLQNGENMHVNVLAIKLDLTISKLANLLFELEMKGIVQCLPGGIYRLL